MPPVLEGLGRIGPSACTPCFFIAFFILLVCELNLGNEKYFVGFKEFSKTIFFFCLSKWFLSKKNLSRFVFLNMD